MAIYRVEFSNDWITGRWGFTDRVFSELRGKETEPSRLENAWLVEYKGNANTLGELLSEMLNIRAADFRRFGTIFEITILSQPQQPAGRRFRPRRPAQRPPWERQPDSGRFR